MTELKQLRKLVRLAEAFDRRKGLARSPVRPKTLDLAFPISSARPAGVRPRPDRWIKVKKPGASGV